MQARAFSHPERGSNGTNSRGFVTDDMVRAFQVPLLAGLPSHLLTTVLAEATIWRCETGEPLFHQGEAARFLHIVIDGEVGLFGSASDGEETLVEILKTGEVFIAAAVLTDRPYLMSARALAPSRVLALPADRLRRDLRSVPDLAVAMLDALSGNFRTLVQEVKLLKLKSVTQRLALYLLSLTPKREGSTVTWLPHSKRVIAARIGTRPESLSRAFAALREHGVQSSGTRVSIEDLGRLAAYCDQDDEVV